MTVSGFKKAVADLSIVDYFSFTSLQKVYISRIKVDTFKIDEANETVEFETMQGFKFIHDVNDVNTVLLNPLHLEYSPTQMP